MRHARVAILAALVCILAPYLGAQKEAKSPPQAYPPRPREAAARSVKERIVPPPVTTDLGAQKEAKSPPQACPPRLREAPPRSVRERIVPAPVTTDRKITIRSGIQRRPLGWKKPFHPTRFWGPFHEESDFAQIKLVIGGRPGPELFKIYFDDFFLTHEDPQYYRQYFWWQGSGANPSGQPLPNEANGEQLRLPAGPALLPENGVVFSLAEISFASAYGGSVRLHFNQQEDFGYELSDQPHGYYCDLAGMTADVFVKPDVSKFNRALLRPTDGFGWGRGEMRIRLAFGKQTVYKQVDGQLQVVDLSTDSTLAPRAKSELQKIEAEFETSNAVTARGHLEQFVFGFLHTLLAPDVLTPTDKVTYLPIQDNSFGPPVVNTTRPYFFVQVRVFDLWSQDDISKDVVYITSRWFWAWNVYEPGGGVGEKVCNGHSIDWVNVGTYNVDPEWPSYCDIYGEIRVDYYNVFDTKSLIPGFAENRGINLILPHNGGWSYDDAETQGICDELRQRAARREPGVVRTIDGAGQFEYMGREDIDR
jgi:hypothetical protein